MCSNYYHLLKKYFESGPDKVYLESSNFEIDRQSSLWSIKKIDAETAARRSKLSKQKRELVKSLRIPEEMCDCFFCQGCYSYHYIADFFDGEQYEPTIEGWKNFNVKN